MGASLPLRGCFERPVDAHEAEEVTQKLAMPIGLGGRVGQIMGMGTSLCVGLGLVPESRSPGAAGPAAATRRTKGDLGRSYFLVIGPRSQARRRRQFACLEAWRVEGQGPVLREAVPPTRAACAFTGDRHLVRGQDLPRWAEPGAWASGGDGAVPAQREGALVKRVCVAITLILMLAPAAVGAQETAPSAAAVPAGAGTGSEPPSVPSPLSAPSSIAEPSGDQVIERRLTGIFAAVEELRQVRPTVRSGVVRLQGATASVGAHQQPVELARKIEGVVFVDDDITESTDVAERIEPTLGRFAQRANAIVQRAPIYGVALAVAVVFAILSGLLRRFGAPFRLMIRRKIVRDIVQQCAALIVLLVGLLIALELAEATALVAAVLGAAGLAGIAFGFAFRDIAENYLASFLLGIRRPFSANDLVIIEGHEGLVVRLTMRETVLMTLDGNHVSLPNAMVFKAVIINFTTNPLRRFQFTVGVGVTSDLVDAQKVGREALGATPGVVADPPPFVRVEELGDSNVVVRLHGWVDQSKADWYKVRSEAVRRAKVAFEGADIDMPIPMQRLQIEAAPAAPAVEPRPALRTVDDGASEVAPDNVLMRQIAGDKRADHGDDLLEAAAE